VLPLLDFSFFPFNRPHPSFFQAASTLFYLSFRLGTSPNDFFLLFLVLGPCPDPEVWFFSGARPHTRGFFSSYRLFPLLSLAVPLLCFDGRRSLLPMSARDIAHASFSVAPISCPPFFYTPPSLKVLFFPVSPRFPSVIHYFLYLSPGRSPCPGRLARLYWKFSQRRLRSFFPQGTASPLPAMFSGRAAHHSL